MPAIDKCRPQFVRALQKLGWEVDPKPYTLDVDGRRRLMIDVFARQQQGRSWRKIIVIELKCFSDEKSELLDLYIAIGQYLIYRNLLKQRGYDYTLYLAVPRHAYEGVFQQLAMPLINEIDVKMIVFNLENEVIEQWLD